LHLDQTYERGEIDSSIEKDWARKELWDEISKLPKKQRTVVMLRINDTLSYKEISDITGMSEGTAKVNYHHALKKLKEVLDNE
jgi:RNA polymerase sigma-70 factor (ECF subfamily)